jgi:hypothetical protein
MIHGIVVVCVKCHYRQINVQVDTQHIEKHQGTEVVCVRHGGTEGRRAMPMWVTYLCLWPVQVISPPRQCQLGRAAHMLLPLQSGLHWTVSHGTLTSVHKASYPLEGYIPLVVSPLVVSSLQEELAWQKMFLCQTTLRTDISWLRDTRTCSR